MSGQRQGRHLNGRIRDDEGAAVPVGYLRVSKADGAQSTDLQRDALLAAGIAPDALMGTRPPVRRRTALTWPPASRRCGPATPWWSGGSTDWAETYATWSTSVVGGGVTVSSRPAEVVQWREQVGRLLDVLEAGDTGLLITVDEVHKHAPRTPVTRADRRAAGTLSAFWCYHADLYLT